MMKKHLMLTFLLFWGTTIAAFGQSVGVKSNLLYDATATPNLGLEIGVSPRWTIDVSAGYNPWTFPDNKKWKNLFIQPEARYWLCERFNGHFFGIHALGGMFNIGGVNLFGLRKEHRYEGWAAGAGLTYGYQWMLGRRWNLEASLGLGYIWSRSDKYECAQCGKVLEKNVSKGFFTPTRAAISIIYIIK